MARRASVSLKPRAKKIPLPRTPKMVDTKYLGLEPTPENLIDNDFQLTRAYNWYNHFFGLGEAKEWTVEYFQDANPDLSKLLAKVPESQFSTTVGWISRMQSRGVEIPSATIKWREDKIQNMIALIKQNLQVSTNQDKGGYKQPSYVNDISNLEDLLDVFVQNGYKDGFSCYDYLQTNNVGKMSAINIADHFSELSDELQLLVEGTDKELNEGYRKLKKAQKTAYSNLVKSIVTDCQVWSQNKTKIRKPVKPRKKSETQILKNFKYLKEHPPLKIVSIDPTKIIGAKCLIAFNHKYNRLIVYQSKEGESLGINTVNITGFDESTSLQKTVRKPEVNLMLFLSGTETAVMKKIKEAKAQPSIPSKRITQDTVLIRVYK